MGIREEADVEEQVGVARRTVLEAEALDRDGELAGHPCRQEGVRELAAEHRRRQTGRLDHDVGALTDRGEQRPLARDPVEHAAGGRQRVAAAGLLIAGQERLLVGLEEQHAGVDAGALELADDLDEAGEVAAPARVGDDGRPLHLRPLVHEQLGQ